jgi:diacylglycerol kinase family enzyme
MIICMGGDGILHQLINALYRQDALSIPLAIIPLGSQNATACSLGGKNVYDAAFYAIKNMTVKADLFKVNLDDREIVASVAVAWGIVSQISEEAQNIRLLGTKVRPRQRYTVAGIKKFLSRIQDNEARVLLTDEFSQRHDIEGPFMFVVGCNHSCQSSLSEEILAPKSQINDGLIDVQVMQPLGRLALLKFIYKMRNKGSHLDLPGLTNMRARTMKIVTGKAYLERYQAFNIDGEIYHSTSACIEILPSCITLAGSPTWEPVPKKRLSMPSA